MASLVYEREIGVAGPHWVVTMTTSCCFRCDKVNGVIILKRHPNTFTAELSSSFFQAAKVGSIKGIYAIDSSVFLALGKHNHVWSLVVAQTQMSISASTRKKKNFDPCACA